MNPKFSSRPARAGAAPAGRTARTGQGASRDRGLTVELLRTALHLLELHERAMSHTRLSRVPVVTYRA